MTLVGAAPAKDRTRPMEREKEGGRVLWPIGTMFVTCDKNVFFFPFFLFVRAPCECVGSRRRSRIFLASPNNNKNNDDDTAKSAPRPPPNGDGAQNGQAAHRIFAVCRR
nr:hypothetical protein [Pandoravirus belohorizontensis]